MKNWGWALALLLLAAGCSKPPAKTGSATPETKDGANPPLANSADPGTTNPDPGTASPNAPTTPPTPPKAGGTPPTLPTLNTKRFDIPKTGEGNWKTGGIAGTDLAARIGKAIQTMKGVEGKSRTVLKTPAGNGMVQSDVKIQDGKTYVIQFPVIKDLPEAGEIRANGRVRASRNGEGKLGPQKPVATKAPEAALPPAKIAANWPKEFPRLAFLGLTDGKDAWKPLLEQLTSGKAGFNTEISKRTMEYKKRQITSYRVVARRTPAAEKKLGPCEMEMVFDGMRYLPVTIRVNMTDPKGHEWKVLWQAGWNFQKTFKPAEFAMQ